ncbi:MAG: hypothetical protein ACTSXH_14385 [Promethearchaeota archaeon]
MKITEKRLSDMHEEKGKEFEKIYYHVGTRVHNQELYNYIKITEKRLSDMHEEKGKEFEKNGNILEAIKLYEKALWVNPNKSHLRAHVESVRDEIS